jgi:hypothetical protein
MPFTDEEKRSWHEEKRKREYRPTPIFRSAPVAICVHCHNPFGITEGVITSEIAALPRLSSVRAQSVN